MLYFEPNIILVFKYILLLKRIDVAIRQTQFAWRLLFSAPMQREGHISDTLASVMNVYP